MKTTVDLPDEILHRAKILAVRRRTTLKNLIIQGLDHITRSAPQDEAQQRLESLQRLISGLKASNSQPMSPLKREEIYDR